MYLTIYELKDKSSLALYLFGWESYYMNVFSFDSSNLVCDVLHFTYNNKWQKRLDFFLANTNIGVLNINWYWSWCLHSSWNNFPKPFCQGLWNTIGGMTKWFNTMGACFAPMCRFSVVSVNINSCLHNKIPQWIRSDLIMIRLSD